MTVPGWLFVTILMILVSYYSTSAQAICPLKTLSVGRVQGRVSGLDTIPFSLPHTKVVLMRLGDPDDVLVGTSETDDTGFFGFNRINKGQYRLTAYFMLKGLEVAPKYDVILKVKKSNLAKSDMLIDIFLAVDCGDNIVKLTKKK